MNLKIPKLNTNIWIILSALLILIFFYIFYLEYYVKGKESRIISTRFRVLDQMGKNVDKRLGSFIRNANDLKKKINPEWGKAVRDFKYGNCSDTLKCLINRLNTRGDINKNLKVVDFITDVFQAGSGVEMTENRSLKNLYFYVQVEESPFKVQAKSGKSLMLFETSYQNLMEGLDRNDVFDDLILIRDSIVVYNTLGQEMILKPQQNGKWHLESERLNNDIGELDLKKSETHLGVLFSGEAFDLTISNQVFKAFLKPIEVNKETWYALGLMKKSKFKATSRSIEPWIIILLSLLLIFIILGMPVIKLLVMSSTEQLDTSTIVSYALSIVLGGSILVMFVFFLSQDLLRRRVVNHHLKELSEDIYNSFTGELQTSYNQLVDYDTVYDSMNFYNRENYFHNNIVNDILNRGKYYYPSAYPYGDYYFWVDNNGVQSAYLTPIMPFGKLSNLSKRDYVNKKDEWFLPGSTDKKFRVESIVSITSGTVKAAISKKSQRVNNPVIAISSRFYSIINTIIPKDYAFCIIDRSGKVWFHSNENLNEKENFISECNDNDNLKAAIYAGIPKTINVNYYNQPHRIHISPIDRLPLHLVTMYNKQSGLSFQAQVVTLTLALIGFFMLMLFIQLIALLSIERHFRLALTKNFIMKLTRPIMRLNGRYQYLIRVYLIIIVLITPFMIWFQGIHAIAAIFTLTIILFTYSYWILNDNDFKRLHRRWFGFFNFFLLILVNVVSFVLLKGEESWKVLLFEGTIIAALFICELIFKKDNREITNAYWTNFNRLLVLILILLGIFPTLKFYELAFNAETEIRTMHKLLDIGHQREIRNLTIDSYYKRFRITDKVNQVKEQRKDLGIYTDFLGMDYHKQWSPAKDHDSLTRNNYWDRMIGYLRPFYDDHVVENKFLILTKLKNDNISWFQNNRQLVLRHQSLTEMASRNVISPYYLSSDLSKLNFYVPFHEDPNKGRQTTLLNILFWLMVIGMIFIFYKLLKFGVFRIFCHDIIENYYHQDFDQVLRQQMMANKDIMVTRLSTRDESDHFSKAFLSEKGSYSIDWSVEENIGDTPKKVNQLIKQHQQDNEAGDSITIFIDRFAAGYEDLKLFEEKLKVVLMLTNKKDIKLVLFSQFSPEVILAHYRDAIEELKQKMVERSKRVSYKLDNYQKILNEFSQLIKILIVDYLPVRYHIPAELEDRYCLDKPRKIQNKELIRGELHASDYLVKYENAILQYNEDYCEDKKVGNPEELIVTKINSLAENYFEDLFTNCTPEEQYVLYDLAFDQIMNSRNEKAIFSLLQKGLLVKKCYKINFMNISFRRFVISKLNKSAKIELEKQMGKESGNWQGYRVTLIMFIFGLFVFIALANQDFIDDLNQLFIAIGGGIAVITGILGLLSRKSKSTAD